jgi:hypothetical protein
VLCPVATSTSSRSSISGVSTKNLLLLLMISTSFVCFFIQCGNFNWNKIHNLDIGDFCKKSRNRSIFVFPCPYFGAYGFSISAPGSSQPPLTFFFKWTGMPSDISFESPLRKEYNALFVS